MAIRVCAQNAVNSEFTLCGDAFDAFVSGYAAEEHNCAGRGQVVTCPKCCQIIQNLRDMRHRLKPNKA